MRPQNKQESVLQKIGTAAQNRVNEQKSQVSFESLQEAYSRYSRKPNAFESLFASDGLNVIAEVKLASPSQGDIALALDPVRVAEDYLNNGARALSILTEPFFFKGQLDYLRSIRAAVPAAPLLQKDFIVDPYQLFEAALAGADAILIIVALLGHERSQSLLNTARLLGLTALVEVHNREELEIAKAIGASLIGINNRNLKDLSISLDVTRELLPHCPTGAHIICESGLSKHQDLIDMRVTGCHGFLIGTSLMRTGNPGAALQRILHGES